MHANNVRYVHYKKQTDLACVPFALCICMLQRRKAQVNWNSFDGAFAKSRRLHLVKGSDGLDHCFVTSCEHAEFASKRGCCKHAKTKHDWYYYFDEKPNVCNLPSTIDERNANKEFKTVPCCSTDNDFTRSFSKWLQSSSGGGKSRKQSDISVTRALKFIKFHSDENGGGRKRSFVLLISSTMAWDVLSC